MNLVQSILSSAGIRFDRIEAAKCFESVIRQHVLEGAQLYYSTTGLQDVFYYIKLIAERGEPAVTSNKNTKEAMELVVQRLHQIFFIDPEERSTYIPSLYTDLRNRFPVRNPYDLKHIGETIAGKDFTP